MNFAPNRIVCLTEETTELLYLLGEEDRIVGISNFTKRPTRAAKEKEKVSAFLDADLDRIEALKPDLVMGFSDIQADIAQKLIKRGIGVWITNHRSVKEIFTFIMQLGALFNRKEAALKLVEDYTERMVEIQAVSKGWKRRPSVYFEEWYDPLISGICWVSELIEIAGGVEAFPEFRNAALAKDRIIENPEIVVQRNPDIMLASWCGKKFKLKKVLQRSGWKEIRAIQNQQVFAIDSAVILQPGPASLSQGLEMMHQIFKNWVSQNED